MKPIHITIALILIIIITACQRHALSQGTTTTTYNHTITDAHGNMMLLGKSTRERLQQEPFGAWFNKNYADYKVDSATANTVKPLLQHKRFVIFMGTWCGDSRREVPRIYKILDYLGVQASQITLVNVNNADTAYKQSPTHEERGLNIIRVPDLLVYEDNKELGRIVESPVVSLEKDLLAIAGKTGYTPHYAAANTRQQQPAAQ